MDKFSFIFYTEWLDFLTELSGDDFKAVIVSICSLCEKDEEPCNLSEPARVAFKCIRKIVERNNERYEEIRSKRSEAGRNGANKRWQKIASGSKNSNCYNLIANDSNAWQSVANIAVNDNDNVNDTLINESNNYMAINSHTSGSQANTDDSAMSRTTKIDAKAFAEFFNKTMDEAGAQIPRVRQIRNQRLGFLNGRLNEYGKEALVTVVRKSASSLFLNGGGDRGFVADFSWIFRPNNFPKILEGNYDNRNTKNNGDTSKDKRRGTEADNFTTEDYHSGF